jgi:hypothetical protein
MPETQRSENFSCAYIRAIAAHVGLNVSQTENDFGIDISFTRIISYQPLSRKRGKRYIDDPHAIPLRFQVKSTKNWIFVGDIVRCKLEAKAYDDAIYAKGALPLLMMCLPPTFDDWLCQDEVCLQLRHCCYYWKPSANDTMTPNDSTKTIFIPKGQQFTPEALTELFTARQRGIQS